MRRFSQRSYLVTLSEINITPLLDLAFVLLIIFVITTPLLEQSINLKLPRGGQPDKLVNKRDIRTVEVSATGVYALDRRRMAFDEMIASLAAGLLFARLFRLGDAFGALAGAACAVCGASAALATSSVLPDSRDRETNTAFVVITTNLIATFAVVAYPAWCAFVGFDDRTTGIFLGASIHDVAQVVGAGYSVSKTAGNIALVVKLFRVFLLLPVVLGVGWFFARQGAEVGKAKVPVPVFALMFLVFVAINSSGLMLPFAKEALLTASRWGLLLALAALGLNTSLASIARVGLKPVLAVGLTTAVVFALPAAWLATMGH